MKWCFTGSLFKKSSPYRAMTTVFSSAPIPPVAIVPELLPFKADNRSRRRSSEKEARRCPAQRNHLITGREYCTEMAKKAAKKMEEEPLKLFYIFYNQERWDNWLKTLSEASFEAGREERGYCPEGFRILDGFSVDITIEVLKILKLYQNKRFSAEDALEKLAAVEAIVMSVPPKGDLEELVEILQLPKLVLFAGSRKYLSGTFDKDIKTLVKTGKGQIEKDMEGALETASNIAAAVIDGAACCGKYVKDDLENPTLFDEWLIECERISDSMTSLKNFDESTGDDD